jgi:hypothetical protein
MLRYYSGEYSGERVSNTWVIYLDVRDKPGKLGLIPDNIPGRHRPGIKGGATCRNGMNPRSISLMVG